MLRCELNIEYLWEEKLEYTGGGNQNGNVSWSWLEPSAPAIRLVARRLAARI